MDIGLYRFKNGFRRLFDSILPFLKNVNPNTLSLLLIPLGIATVLSFYFAKYISYFYLLAVFLLFFRMVLATLDGYVAVTYKKQSAKGELLNRLAPELCDVMLLCSLLLIFKTDELLVISILGIAWFSSFLGLVGFFAKLAPTSVGPVGQTDRLLALMLCTVGMFFNEGITEKINFMDYFYYWCVLGGIATIMNRFWDIWKRLNNIEIKQ